MLKVVIIDDERLARSELKRLLSDFPDVEIIGEAANRLPDDFKEKYPEVDWHRIRGFRNRIVHYYFGIDCAIVWEIKTSFLPDLLIKLKGLRL